MKIKYFTIPAFDNGAANEELNKFLRSHRVCPLSPFLTHWYAFAKQQRPDVVLESSQ
jgi:hypothetical protein